MKILVENGSYNLLNVGDVAMLQVSLSRVRSLLPDAELYVFTKDPDKLARIAPYAKPILPIGRNIYFRPGSIFIGMKRFPKIAFNKLNTFECRLIQSNLSFIGHWIKFSSKIIGLDVSQLDSFLRLFKSADAVISTGGGFIMDHFLFHAVNALQMFGLAKKLGKPVVLFSQGIGPIKSNYLWKLAQFILPQVDLIAIRERRASLPLLQSMGVDLRNVVSTGDDAVELSFQTPINNIKRFIGLNIRAAYYSEIDQEEINIIFSIVNKFAKQKSVSLLPIPISFNQNRSDLHTLSPYIPIDHLEGYSVPEYIIDQISHCCLVITGSYHAGVFALSQGIPVIAFAKSRYYLDKFEGLADQFKFGCLVVRIDKGLFPKILEEALHLAWNEMASVRQPLLEAAERQIHESRKAYEKFRILVQSS